MMCSLRLVLLLTVLLTVPSLKSWAISPSDDPLLVIAKATPYEWSAGQGGQLEIKMKLPAEFHAYEDKFNLKVVAPEGFQISTPKIKPIVEWYDHFSKKNRRGVKGEATMTAHLEAPDHFANATDHLVLQLSYQACSDQFCLFPVTKTIDVPIQINLTDTSTPPLTTVGKTADTSTGSFFDTSHFSHYLGDSLLAGLLFVFLAGIFTSFTPCIFPMIPITLAVLGNHAQERSRLQNFTTSCVYVLGIATTYSILGLLAASSGRVFGASLGNPYILSFVCVIFLAMALGMYGLYELQVPAFVRNRLGRSSSSNKGLIAAYTTGLLAGIVASPCVGPVLVAILTYVASTQNKLWGFLFLFFYALGLGLIFILLGLFSQLRTMLPRSGGWMNLFKFILGTLMMSAFFYYFSLLVPERFFDVALGIALVIIASVYGAFLSTKGISTLQRIQKGLMQATMIIGAAYLALGLFDLRPMIRSHMIAATPLNQIQEMKWQPYSEQALQQAQKDHMPVIIDFWAEWCVACHEMEEKTFTDPRIRAESGSFVLLKFDATNESALLSELKTKYKLQGLPTVIFINPEGKWLESLTLSAFEDATGFIKRMDGARQ